MPTGHGTLVRRARLLACAAVSAAMLLAGLGGCAGGTSPAGRSVTVAVSQARAVRVTVPGVATVSGPAGALRGTGTITVTPVRLRLPFDGALQPAGTGVDVRFSRVWLARPLTITFADARKPPAGTIPVVAHLRADGVWDLTPVKSAKAGRMTVTTAAFSPHVPAYLNPRRWVQWLGSRLASLVGGRTAPINCPGGAPRWASVLKQTDEAHTCLISNPSAADHSVRAELQVKSNRGTALEVDVPSGADYTWVEGEPWAIRQQVWRHLIHQDPNAMVLLPPGGTMTAGYRQPIGDEQLPFHVQPSYWSMAYSLIGDVVDALTGSSAASAGTVTTVLYLVSKCSSAIDYGSLTVSNPLSTATFAGALKCVINDALTGLSSPATALGAARSLLGPGIDQADLATATRELTSVGGKLLAFGWVLQLWPVLQLGWGGVADVIHGLLTGGTSTLISLTLHGTAGPAPPAGTVTALIPGAATQYSASGIVAWRDGYWFAVAAKNPAGAMSVSIYRWDGHSWQQQARMPIANKNGSLVSGGLDSSTPITAGSLTGAATPDFLIHSFGADTDWLNVVSDATGQWAAVPFNDSGGPTLGENYTGITGNVITVGYNGCLPNCAQGKITEVRFHYRNGLFAPVDAPGSCTGEALAQAAHATYSQQSHGQYAITGYACANGYAAAAATNESYGWTITFHTGATGWQVLASGNLMPRKGIPAQAYQLLHGQLASSEQDAYYPY